MTKKTTKPISKRPDWAKKIPRSSRVCFRCNHKYSSHVPSCGKIVEKKPLRKECDCRTFVKNEYELDLAMRFEAKDDREREAKNNAFKPKKET
jgi:hypothetical protein